MATSREQDWENYRIARKAVKALELKVKSERPARRPGFTKKVVIKLRG